MEDTKWIWLVLSIGITGISVALFLLWHVPFLFLLLLLPPFIFRRKKPSQQRKLDCQNCGGFLIGFESFCPHCGAGLNSLEQERH